MDFPENNSVVFRFTGYTARDVSVASYSSHRLHLHMRTSPGVLDYEQFSLCLCSGDGFSDVLAAYDSRALVVGGNDTRFCVAFAMHNKFLVTVVDAMEFIESSMSLVCRSSRFLRLRCGGYGRYPTVAARCESVVIAEGLTVLLTHASGSLGTAREVQFLARLLAGPIGVLTRGSSSSR